MRPALLALSLVSLSIPAAGYRGCYAAIRSVRSKSSSNRDMQPTYSHLPYPTEQLCEAVLVDRYKRFLADVRIPDYRANERDIVKEDGTVVVHCPNTGPMISLLPPSRESPLPCMVSSPSETVLEKSKRKYRYTLEMVKLHDDVWVGVHSALANRIVARALEAGLISEYQGFTTMRREVKMGDSKIDFELTFHNEDDNGIAVEKKVLIEVKSVTLAVEEGCDKERERRAVFPDCVSVRAKRHADCLASIQSRSGVETAIIFLIQRHDCSAFSASEYDEDYKEALHIANKVGVKILPYSCRLDPESQSIEILGKLPFIDTFNASQEKEKVLVKRKRR